MRRLATFAALLMFSAAAPAQERTHAVTPDDYASVAAVTELAVSPDGKLVAYCEARWDAADDLRKTDLWVVATDGKGKPRRLTADRANERHPKWAADGSAVYVLANRKRAAETAPPYDGKPQVWRIPADGGEPRAVTRVPGGVAGFDYAPKADAVFYSVDATATDDDAFAKLRAKHKASYGHGTRAVSEIHRLDVQTWRAEKVVADGRYVREFAATLDGKRLAMITAADDSVIRSEGSSRVDVWDADGGKVTPTDDDWRKTAASPWPWLESLAWNEMGTDLAFCTIFDGHPAEIITHQRATSDGKSYHWLCARVERGQVHVRGYGSPIRFLGYDTIQFLTDAKGLVLPASYQLDAFLNPKMQRLSVRGHSKGDVVSATEIGVGPAGGDDTRWVELLGSNERFPELHSIEAKHQPYLTDINHHTKTWKLPTIQHITWKAPDGSTVGGVLELPPGYKKGDRLPLIVAIHGGPTTSTKAELAFDPHNGRLYLAARGYAVLCPNYRGSTGYGDKFVTDLIGNENDLDVKDILTGVQHLIKEGVADPDRVGVMGWSNGGYLTNCLIAMKDSPVKFKAASSGAGILDTVAEWGFNDEPAYPTVFKKGLPWETPDVYRKTSPTYGLGNVSTPTLIHVGENDVRCPPGHSRMLYRALKEYRKVPTELVVYPGEPHGLTKLSHRKAKMEWDLAWFDKYLLGK